MKIRSYLTGILVFALATIGIQPAYATANPIVEEGKTTPVSHTAETVYADHEIIEFLVFGTGDFAVDNPELTKRIIPERSGGDPEAINQFVAAILSTNPNIHSTVVEPILSGDPYAVQAALIELQENVLRVADVNAQRMSDEVGTQCVVSWLAVVGGVVVVFVAAVAGVGYLVAYVYQYTPDDSSTQFGFEEIVAELAGALGPQ